MKLGLLADIHGNADALIRTLATARRIGVRRLLCAGDCVGYYYEADRCLRLLAEWEDVECVRGNHEDMLSQLMAQPSLAEGIRRRYGSGLSAAERSLSGDQLAYLTALPARKVVHVDGKTVLLCHGSPWDPDAYVYPDADESVFSRCAEAGVDYVIMGHTHHRLVRRFGSTLIINPGSVGQPRDRQPGAAWAVLDTVTGDCALHTETYDSVALEARARATDPHLPYLWEILTRS